MCIRDSYSGFQINPWFLFRLGKSNFFAGPQIDLSYDKIGVIFFSDRIEKFIPPKKGRKHILYIIRELIDFQPERCV